MQLESGNVLRGFFRIGGVIGKVMAARGSFPKRSRWRAWMKKLKEVLLQYVVAVCIILGLIFPIHYI